MAAARTQSLMMTTTMVREKATKAAAETPV
jgi:hypothetical protein